MSAAFEFVPFPKIPRLNRDCVITEKIDGTNASIHISEDPEMIDSGLGVVACSRNRALLPGQGDNFGFRAWVDANAGLLREILGAGRHYGEWWGAGIQRGYGLTTRRFSLFLPKWGKVLEGRKKGGLPVPAALGVVPVLYEGPFSTNVVEAHRDALRQVGSCAEPGFAQPEGLVVFHAASGQLFKVTLEGDEKPKGMAA